MRNERKLLFKFPSAFLMMVLSCNIYCVALLYSLACSSHFCSHCDKRCSHSFLASRTLLFYSLVCRRILSTVPDKRNATSSGWGPNEYFCMIPKYLQHIEISVIPSEDLHIVATFHLELSRFRECGCNGSCISFGKNSSVRSFSAIFMCAVTSTHPVSYKNPCHELESMPGSHCHLTPHWTLSYLCRGAQNRCRAEKK